MKKIKILIANKFFLMNYAIRCILQRIKGFEVYGVSENETLEEIKKIRPDLLVVEIEILKLNSYKMLTEIRKRHPELKIIVLIDADDKEKFLKHLELKLEGYLLKNTTREELVLAANSVHKGERYYSKEIQQAMLENLIEEKSNGKTNGKLRKKLSRREIEVLELIIAGLNNEEISEKLFISQHTVLTHRRNIMRKLKVKSTPQLILTSVKEGIILLN